jgi:hypothetical protein
MTRWQVRSSVVPVVLTLVLAACSDPTRSAEYRDLQERFDAAQAQVVDLEARLADALGRADASDQQIADLQVQLDGARQEALSSQAQLENRIALDRFWPGELASGFTDMCVRRAPDTLSSDQQRTACTCVLSLLEANLSASGFALVWAELATATGRDPITGVPVGADPDPFGPLFGAVDACNTPWLLPAGG